MSAPLAKHRLVSMSSPSLSQGGSLSHGASPVQQRRGNSFFHRLANSLRWVAEYPRRLSVINELQRLTDRELTDIGLTRAEVRNVFIRKTR